MPLPICPQSRAHANVISLETVWRPDEVGVQAFRRSSVQDRQSQAGSVRNLNARTPERLNARTRGRPADPSAGDPPLFYPRAPLRIRERVARSSVAQRTAP